MRTSFDSRDDVLFKVIWVQVDLIDHWTAFEESKDILKQTPPSGKSVFVDLRPNASFDLHELKRKVVEHQKIYRLVLILKVFNFNSIVRRWNFGKWTGRDRSVRRGMSAGTQVAKRNARRWVVHVHIIRPR